MNTSRHSTDLPALGLLLAAGALGYAAMQAATLRYSYEGRVVVITGGSRGLGLAMARELAKQGARLALLARSQVELDRAADELEESGAEVWTVACDLRQEQEVQRAVESIVERYGVIDVLINNAGEITVGPLATMERSDFEEAMALHFWAPLNMTLAMLPHLRREGEGRIVNISSFGGKMAVPHMAAYSASKFALVGLSDALRAELAAEGIRVTTVCPGLLRTGSHRNAFFKGQHRSEYAWFSVGAGLPLNAMGARWAARKILRACRRGRPELVLTVKARLAVITQALLPNTFARGVMLANRCLPGADGRKPDKFTGWQSEAPPWSPSILTRRADRATAEFNGLRGHAGTGEA